MNEIQENDVHDDYKRFVGMNLADMDRKALLLEQLFLLLINGNENDVLKDYEEGFSEIFRFMSDLAKDIRDNVCDMQNYKYPQMPSRPAESIS